MYQEHRRENPLFDVEEEVFSDRLDLSLIFLALSFFFQSSVSMSLFNLTCHQTHRVFENNEKCENWKAILIA